MAAIGRRRYCVIRKYKESDFEDVKDIIGDATMEPVNEFFKGAIFSEIFPQISMCMVGIAFIVFKIPFKYCLASLPFAIGLIYAVIYFAHLIKAMELNDDLNTILSTYGKDPQTGFWVAEVYDIMESNPLAAHLSLTNQVQYEFVTIDQLDAFAENLKGLRKKVVGTIAITHSNLSTTKAWLRRMAVQTDYRRRGIARQMLETVIKFCSSQDYDAIELITTECHYQARDMYQKRGFEQTMYSKSYFNVRQGMYKFIMRLKHEKSN